MSDIISYRDLQCWQKAMDLAELEKRITRIEDRESIKELKARYCAVCDDDHNPANITKLFVEDGIWEGGGFGQAKGHAAIRDLFKNFQQLISFSQHMVMNPIRLVSRFANSLHFRRLLYELAK